MPDDCTDIGWKCEYEKEFTLDIFPGNKLFMQSLCYFLSNWMC